MSATEVRVMPDKENGGWIVRSEGVELSRHDKQNQALRAARQVAEPSEAELIWHSADGEVQGRNSFSEDDS